MRKTSQRSESERQLELRPILITSKPLMTWASRLKGNNTTSPPPKLRTAALKRNSRYLDSSHSRPRRSPSQIEETLPSSLFNNTYIYITPRGPLSNLSSLQLSSHCTLNHSVVLHVREYSGVVADMRQSFSKNCRKSILYFYELVIIRYEYYLLVLTA